MSTPDLLSVNVHPAFGPSKSGLPMSYPVISVVVIVRSVIFHAVNMVFLYITIHVVHFTLVTTTAAAAWCNYWPRKQNCLQGRSVTQSRGTSLSAKHCDNKSLVTATETAKCVQENVQFHMLFINRVSEKLHFEPILNTHIIQGGSSTFNLCFIKYHLQSFHCISIMNFAAITQHKHKITYVYYRG